MKQIIFLIGIIFFHQIISSAEVPEYENEDRVSCETYVKNKMPLFGDLHVHTALSLDANTQGTLNTPDDAYRFAQGQSLYLQPYNEDGTSPRISTLKKNFRYRVIK